ncbi:methyltransferase like protein [Fusarium denticulatum]|uniref:Methyltransferase like protein n=1 Tax=Fusarium denticulatum TaxID=48507 RepID=A0A8H5U6R7_9HYPO|nr:methyltransferase like protein [Fusarium denticulatum]
MDASSDYRDVRSSIWFLEEKDLYATVKPYSLAFTPETGIPRENITRHEVEVPISDIRTAKDTLTFDKNGFTIIDLPEQDRDFDWADETLVKESHYPNVIKSVEAAFQGSRCVILRHQIRKRDPSFPKSTGRDYEFGQPLRAAHIDMVRSSAEQLIQECLGKEASEIFAGRYVFANVWHPLSGTNQDWPLAICDASTVDQQRDVEVADYVTTTTSREHCMVYARETHRWWYLSDHKATEGLVFRQYQSDKGLASGLPHAAFLNPLSEQEYPRESIEVMLVISFPKSH